MMEMVWWKVGVTAMCALWCCYAGADVCPESCHCQQAEDHYFVYCIGNDLRAVPKHLPVNVTNLDLSLNSLTQLSADSFTQPLPLLKRLDLSTCKVESITINTFASLSSLTELVLDHNSIKDLPAGTFTGLQHLHVLSLNDNDLIFLENNVFEGLSLQQLNLFNNQFLFGLSSGVFSNAEVEVLALDRCALSNIPEDTLRPLAASLRVVKWSYSKHPLVIPARLFEGMQLASLHLTNNMVTNASFLHHTSAKDLDLSHNSLQTFNLAGHRGLEQTENLILKGSNLYSLQARGPFMCGNLKELDLSENHLSFVSAKLFVGMTNLTRLNLRGNSITYLPEGLLPLFSSLSFLDVQDNALTCSCNMTWFREFRENADPEVIRTKDGQCRATLDVCRKPLIQRITHYINPGFVTLSCDSQGSPPPDITWKLNFSNLGFVENETEHISSTYDKTTLLQTSKIRVPLRAPSNSCLSFMCTASNPAGTDEDMTTICGVGVGHEPVAGTSQGHPSSLSYVPALVGIIVGVGVAILAVLVSSRVLRHRWTRRRRNSLITDHVCSERTLIEDLEDEKGPFVVESV